MIPIFYQNRSEIPQQQQKKKKKVENRIKKDKNKTEKSQEQKIAGLKQHHQWFLPRNLFDLMSLPIAKCGVPFFYLGKY